MEGSLFVVRRRCHPHFMVRFTAGVMQTCLCLGGWSVVSLPSLSLSPFVAACVLFPIAVSFLRWNRLEFFLCFVCAEELGVNPPARVLCCSSKSYAFEFPWPQGNQATRGYDRDVQVFSPPTALP